MKSLGYVNRYNRGIGQVQKELSENGNPPAQFDVTLLTAFAVEVKKCTSQDKKGHQSEGTSQTTKGHQSHNKEHRPFGKNILTLKERVVDFCSAPKSITEIASFLGVKNKRKARERYIDPQLGITLERTIPDKPTSRLQKYVAIKKGTSQK